jgi:1,4-alpha-glucan branching enzyme
MKALDQNPSLSYSARHMAKPVHFFCEAPKAAAVYLVGDFNHWDPVRNRMVRRVDGWWFVEVYLTHGHHRYRFLVDGNPVLDPRANGVARDDQGEEVSVVAVS